MKSEELNRLIDELLDGVCSEADFLRLEAEMHVNPEARTAYYERMKLHTILQLEGAETSAKIIRFPNWRRQLPWLIGVAAAVMILIAGSLGWRLGKGEPQAEVVRTEPAAAGFGVLAEQSNALWNGRALKRGDLLPSGTLKLESGIAQLELFSGVTVIIEGSAEFEIRSGMEMSVVSGKMRAIVPKPARGFRVRTASGDVVDLGTEFAIDVGPEHSDLHVLNGEIEWHPVSNPSQRLVDGESFRWSASGELSALDSAVDQFPGVTDLDAKRAERHAAWRAHSEQIRRDPRLLGYFPMQLPGGKTQQLLDRSGADQHGTIVRAKRATDRWDEPNSALDFSPTGSRVRLTIPGEHTALTLHCWVRIDSLDRWYNSLFLTDGHELNEPHWQIMDDGRLFFSVKKRNPKKGESDKHIAYSPPIWTPALSGQWLQIATVYDSGPGTTTHYVNGQQVSQDKLPESMVVERVQIGAASIGNWSEPKRLDPHFAVRNLNGAIDEFAIFSAALTAVEIERLYEIGKP
ncbi:MAG: hypothetical protein ACI8UO_001036 [Verrucomicrobiales bacterium]|jgi:hypothetical protein